MKIVCDMSVLELPVTGVGKAVVGLYDACFKRLYEFEATAVHRRPLKTRLNPRFIQQQKGSYLPDTLWRKFILPAMVKRSGSTWVHFPWSGHVPRLPAGVNVTTTLHDVLPLIIPGYFKGINEEKNYRERIQQDIDRTHLLFTDSEFSKKEILRNFDVRSEPVVLMLASTLDTGQITPEPKNDPRANYFFYVGGSDQRKGLEQLVRVFARLHSEKNLKSKLLIAGDKRFISAECEHHLDVLRSLTAVEELGYISDHELAHRLKGAVALVYPSKFEGFGLPPLEAMSLGCPVITTRCTSLPDICGDAAWYIDPDDEESFVQSLIALSSDPSRRNELKEKGLKQAAKFSWDRTAEQFLNQLQSVEQGQSNQT